MCIYTRTAHPAQAYEWDNANNTATLHVVHAKSATLTFAICCHTHSGFRVTNNCAAGAVNARDSVHCAAFRVVQASISHNYEYAHMHRLEGHGRPVDMHLIVWDTITEAVARVPLKV